jgi:hypothetical protein
MSSRMRITIAKAVAAAAAIKPRVYSRISHLQLDRAMIDAKLVGGKTAFVVRPGDLLPGDLFRLLF